MPHEGDRHISKERGHRNTEGWTHHFNAIVHLLDRNDYGPNGFVREVGSDYVEIQIISNNGEPDGYSTVLLSGISKIHVGRRQDQVLEFLYRYNHDLKRLLGS
jgi:hypothetical protein